MSFQERLQRASERGKQARAAQLNEAAAKALSEEECRRLHSQYRLALTDHIEKCLNELADNFPGFRVETVVDEAAGARPSAATTWRLAAGRRGNFFSRLRIVVGPYSQYHVLDIAAKGTVRNKEVLSRNHYQRLAEVDLADVPRIDRNMGARLRRTVFGRRLVRVPLLASTVNVAQRRQHCLLFPAGSRLTASSAGFARGAHQCAASSGTRVFCRRTQVFGPALGVLHGR